MVAKVGDRAYHHGDLRRAVLAETVDALAASGASALSLRAVARRAGVAHTSVAHHFGDKAGLLTAVATEGFGLLADELRAVHVGGGGFLELGVAYVRFAVGHPAHFEVMFRPQLHRPGDPDLEQARATTYAMLHGHASELTDAAGAPVTAIAGWSLVHGLASLWMAGNLPPWLGDDPEAIARLVAAELGVRRHGSGSVDG